MINYLDSFRSLSIEPTLIAKCLIVDDFNITMNNVIALGCTSKANQGMIKTDLFFKKIVELIDPNHPFFLTVPENKQDTSFKQKCYELRNCFLKDIKEFSESFIGEAYVGEEGIEVISWGKEILSLKLNNILIRKPTKIFEDIKFDHDTATQFINEANAPYVARSERFLALNFPFDSTINVYENEILLAKFKVEGSISQLEIKDDFLYVLINSGGYYNQGDAYIVVFNLKTALLSEGPINKIRLFDHQIPSNFCHHMRFTNEYFIFEQHLGRGPVIHALPLTFLQEPQKQGKKLPWITKNTNSTHSRVLLNDDHLIEVREQKEKRGVFNIFKYVIQSNDFVITELAKDVVFYKDTDCFIGFFLYRDRLIFANEYQKTTHISYYDMLTEKVTELIDIPELTHWDVFPPRFLRTATKIYYLVTTNYKKTVLATLTWGEI